MRQLPLQRPVHHHVAESAYAGVDAIGADAAIDDRLDDSAGIGDAVLCRFGQMETRALGNGGDVAPAEMGIDDDASLGVLRHGVLRPGSRQ